MSEIDKEEFNTYKLNLRQALPLEDKIRLTKNRIKQWYEYNDGNVYIGFSGGKDSDVLAHLVWEDYPDVKGVFSNTGLEYPEIVEFVKSLGNKIITIRPKLSFNKVIQEYGYPIISKEQSQYIYNLKQHSIDAKLAREIYSLKDKYTVEEIMASYNIKSKWIVERVIGNKSKRGKVAQCWFSLLDAPFKVSDKCCYHLKKSPFHKFEKETGLKPFLGEMAIESDLRKTNYIRQGCNAFNAKRPVSRPMAFWTDEDVWQYIKVYNIPYSRIYDMGYERTGCMFCAYGIHLDKGVNKFQLLNKTHPNLHDYCINKLGIGNVLDYIGVKYI